MCHHITDVSKLLILSLVCTVKLLGVIFQNTTANCQELQLDGLHFKINIPVHYRSPWGMLMDIQGRKHSYKISVVKRIRGANE